MPIINLGNEHLSKPLPTQTRYTAALLAGKDLYGSADLSYVHDPNVQVVEMSAFENVLIGAIHRAATLGRGLVLTPQAIWGTIMVSLGIGMELNRNGLMHWTNLSEKRKIISKASSIGLPTKMDLTDVEVQNQWASMITDDGIWKITGLNIFPDSGLYAASTWTYKYHDTIEGDEEKKQKSAESRISSIELEGTKEDWQKVLNACSCVVETDDLNREWYRRLAHILQKFVAVYDGEKDKSFWKKMYVYQQGTYGDSISGWITDLFRFERKYSESSVKYLYRDFKSPIGVTKILPSVYRTAFSIETPEELLFAHARGGLTDIIQVTEGEHVSYKPVSACRVYVTATKDINPSKNNSEYRQRYAKRMFRLTKDKDLEYFVMPRFSRKLATIEGRPDTFSAIEVTGTTPNEVMDDLARYPILEQLRKKLRSESSDHLENALKRLLKDWNEYDFSDSDDDASSVCSYCDYDSGDDSPKPKIVRGFKSEPKDE